MTVGVIDADGFYDFSLGVRSSVLNGYEFSKSLMSYIACSLIHSHRKGDPQRSNAGHALACPTSGEIPYLLGALCIQSDTGGGHSQRPWPAVCLAVSSAFPVRSGNDPASSLVPDSLHDACMMHLTAGQIVTTLNTKNNSPP